MDSKTWKPEELESVNSCPYCASINRKVAYTDVEDWTFYCASGSWTYWKCQSCSTLFLDPRPTVHSIGKAYGSYYTHKPNGGIFSKFRNLLRNEMWSHLLNCHIDPRLYLPKWVSPFFFPFKNKVNLRFGLKELIEFPKGKLMDVGCGGGQMLLFANALGWESMGLEIDPAAVNNARAKGLNIIEGGHKLLEGLKSKFDLVVCSHVLEHVHDPINMLNAMNQALMPGGTLLLSLPNATSEIGQYFGKYWRGLEAPRHLSIPSNFILKSHIQNLGYTVTERSLTNYPTLYKSIRVKINQMGVSMRDLSELLRLTIGYQTPKPMHDDYIQFICVKNKEQS